MSETKSGRTDRTHQRFNCPPERNGALYGTAAQSGLAMTHHPQSPAQNQTARCTENQENVTNNPESKYAIETDLEVAQKPELANNALEQQLET